MSPLPSRVHVCGRSDRLAIAETSIVVGIVYGVTSMLVRIDLQWRLAALPIFMTHAVEALRITMLDGASLRWSGAGGWARTLATAAAWFIAGLAVFKFCERVARRQGSHF